MRIHRLVKTCEYGDDAEEQVFDRFVLGLKDFLGDKLQLVSDLITEKAFKEVRHRKRSVNSAKSNPVVVRIIYRRSNKAVVEVKANEVVEEAAEGKAEVFRIDIMQSLKPWSPAEVVEDTEEVTVH